MALQVIRHPAELDDDEMKLLAQSLSAPIEEREKIPVDENADQESADDPAKLIYDMPRNTVIATPIGTSHQVSSVTKILCYPFFSSHVSLPIKEGEFLWVLTEIPFQNERDVGPGPFYWMSRVHGSLISEDVSYTHYERQFDNLNLNFSKVSKQDPEVIKQMKEYEPSFPARIFSDELKPLGMDSKIYSTTPVPRYTKQPGDTVIQGSNNTCISLGSSISMAFSEPLDPKTPIDLSQEPRSTYSFGGNDGAIDIVVGRSQNIVNSAGSSDGMSNVQVKNGEPLTVSNTLKEEEVKKNPTFLDVQSLDPEATLEHPRFFNQNEGDPDIIHDASRFYLGRDEDVDTLFGIPTLISSNLYHEQFVETSNIQGKNTGGDISKLGISDPFEHNFPLHVDSTGPCIAAKSKNIRIIARSFDDISRSVFEGNYDDKPVTETALEGEQGSIILIKEGKVQGEELSKAIEESFGGFEQHHDQEDRPFVVDHPSEDGNGRAVIALAGDGTVYIDGPRIVIGSGIEKDNGAGTQIALGNNAHQSLVMGQQLNETLKAFMEDVIKFISETFVNHGHSTGTGPSGPAGTGADIPATQQGVQAHGTDIQALIDRLHLHLSKIGKTK